MTAILPTAPISAPPGPEPSTGAWNPAQAQVPFVEAITRYRGLATGALHVPGHAGGTSSAASLRMLLGTDMLRSDVWLGTSAFDEVRRAAEALAARAWGAEHAFFLLDGSSGGNRAVHAAALQPDRRSGGHVVLARDSHISSLAGLIISGAIPHWIPPRLDRSGYGISLGITPGALGTVLTELAARGTPADQVQIVSPGYTGACSDVPNLATIAHAHDVPLIVDEAWGAHLPFHPDLPPHAMAAGADLAVTSVHKMLPALSGGALLMTRGARVDAARLDTAVRLTQTTSPLLPVLASIDQARQLMMQHGSAFLGRALQLADDTRIRLSAIPGIRVADAHSLGLAPGLFDPLRLLVGVRGLGMTGHQVDAILRAGPPAIATGGITHPTVAVEGADEDNLIVAITPGTAPAALDTLVIALSALASRRPRLNRRIRDPHLLEALLAPRTQACTPRQAHYARTELVPLRAAIGRISAEPIAPYPPGIPAVVPGELLDDDVVLALTRAIDAGMHIHGPHDPTLTEVRVVRALPRA